MVSLKYINQNKFLTFPMSLDLHCRNQTPSEAEFYSGPLYSLATPEICKHLGILDITSRNSY